MKRTLFITGTDTGVGKTVLTALLAAFLRERGVRVAALKPLCSGGRGDARRLHAALGGGLTLDEINPWHFRAPLAPALAAQRAGKQVKLAAVLAHIRGIRKNFDALLIEGAGGLLSPLGEGFDSRNLITALSATPVIVGLNRVGVVNHVRLTLGALPKELRKKAAVVLMSPRKTDASTASNAVLMGELAISNVHRLPWLGEDFSAIAVLNRRGLRKTLAAVAGLAD